MLDFLSDHIRQCRSHNYGLILLQLRLLLKQDAYKSVFFILQNIHFLKIGNFIQTKRELLAQLSGEDRNVLSKALELKNQSVYDFDDAYQILFEWCKNTINKL